MPLPAAALGLSVVGSILPGIISALAGSKTPEQARAAVAPEYDALVNQLVGRGITRQQAEEQANEQIQGAVAEKLQEGALPGWAEGLLSVAGGIGGWMAGAKMAAKAGGKALAKAVSSAEPKLLTSGPAKIKDAEFEMVPPFQRRIEMRPEPMPMSQRDLFRREVAEGARKEMDTLTPPFYRPPPARLPLDEDAYIAEILRSNPQGF